MLFAHTRGDAMILLIGFLIGFLGYVMINSINLSVIEISYQNKKRKLLFFIFLTFLFESLYCFFSLYGLQFLMTYPKVILMAQYVSVAFVFLIGFYTLFEKVNDAEQQQQNIIRRGYWSIFVHPQQIPFWCFWGIFLIKKSYLQTNIFSLLFFTLSNALGALIILVLYAYFGNKIIALLNLNRKYLKNFVGIICIASGFFLLYDILS